VRIAAERRRSRQGDEQTVAGGCPVNQPDVTGRSTTIFEPRFVLAVARLARQAGDRETSRAEYARFLKFWEHADTGLPELAEAHAHTR
jgi:hypothetical protein